MTPFQRLSKILGNTKISLETKKKWSELLCIIGSPIWQQMPLKDESNSWSHRSVVLQNFCFLSNIIFINLNATSIVKRFFKSYFVFYCRLSSVTFSQFLSFSVMTIVLVALSSCLGRIDEKNRHLWNVKTKTTRGKMWRAWDTKHKSELIKK